MPRQAAGAASPPETPGKLAMESLTLGDVEVREKVVVEDGEEFVVSYAHAIQGQETTKIGYKELRRVCSSLGVRYYKNRPKEAMIELIAIKKLNGQVRSSLLRPPETKMPRQQPRDSGRRKRQCVEAKSGVNIPPLRANLPVSVGPAIEPQLEAPRVPAPAVYGNELVLTAKDRAEAMSLLRSVRLQIDEIELEIAAHGETEDPGAASWTKVLRLKEDLEFYLAERRALMQKLERTRFT
ncbi:hypothetical protein BBJ28_00001332 [Nothophytophthora sp. Chile5]|nr:hypothetical protein BBJ28_00001332 [Nothophytophthora sp. Chile5]